MAEFNLTKVMSGYTGTVASNKIHENDTTLAKTMGLQWARVLGHFNINTVLKQLEVSGQILVYYGLHHEQRVTYSSPTTISYVAGSSSFSDSVIAFDSSINTFVWWDLKTMTERYTSGMYIVALLSRGVLDKTLSTLNFNGKEFSTALAIQQIERLSDKLSVLQTSPRTLYLSYEGVNYDEASGTYTVNDIAGITEDVMRDIYQQTAFQICNSNLKYTFYLLRTPTNLRPIKKHHFGNANSTAPDFDCMRAFGSADEVRKIYLCNSNQYYRVAHNWSFAFENTKKLEEIIGQIQLWPAGRLAPTDITNMFANSSVRSFRLNSLSLNFVINTAPNIDRESMLWMIENSTNTAPITVTVHPNVLERLTEEDIALASSRNITLTA